MMIRQASQRDIPAISRLAHEIWWPTYSGVIADEQITFMLADLYSHTALQSQMGAGITFLIAERDDIPVGFAAYSLTEPENLVYKVEKLYVLPSEQGRGTGKKLIREIVETVKALGARTLELNVNRGNKAFHFYTKLGFEIYKTVDIPYHGFVLNDYIMRISL
jgi:diamine N-acetyltransferase